MESCWYALGKNLGVYLWCVFKCVNLMLLSLGLFSKVIVDRCVVMTVNSKARQEAVALLSVCSNTRLNTCTHMN